MEKREIKFIKDLKGFSGCGLSLYSSDDGYFVRKISKSLEYNERLIKQMAKQKFFQEKLANDKLTAPKVIAEGYIDDLFFFDMEYINGLTLIDFISNATKEDLEILAKDVAGIISHFKKIPATNEEINLAQKFKDKIDEIKRKTLESESSSLDKLNLSILPKLKSTYCHGDLTFENIIYNPDSKKYYLIDFLDNFVDHYWFDLSKMLQDIEGEWYVLKNPQIDRKMMKTKMDFIKTNIFNQPFDGYKNYHNLFMALTFARILPYSKDKKDKEYLLEHIQNYIHQ